MEIKSLADFTVNVPKGRAFRILQVTDTQIIDSSAQRYAGRLSGEETEKWSLDRVDERMGVYLSGAVKVADPDLIVHTGDFTYGEFDDEGVMLDRHVAMMESFGVPWALALGNHERDAAIGEEEYCRRIAAAPHSLFRYHTRFGGERLEGSASYSVLLAAKEKDGTEKPVALLFIVDTGCFNAEMPGGVGERQRAWLRATASAYGVPSYVFLHVPPKCFNDAVAEFSSDPFSPFEIPEGRGFGYAGEYFPERCTFDFDGSLFALLKEIGVKAVFAGHVHKNSYSVPWQGVRLCYGLKTGEYDSHLKDRLGGTEILISADGSFTHRHVTVSSGHDGK